MCCDCNFCLPNNNLYKVLHTGTKCTIAQVHTLFAPQCSMTERLYLKLIIGGGQHWWCLHLQSLTPVIACSIEAADGLHLGRRTDWLSRGFERLLSWRGPQTPTRTSIDPARPILPASMPSYIKMLELCQPDLCPINCMNLV